jgi:hypothetical protein
MKVLIACEESGRVRDAFLAQGHFAISCDLLPTSTPGPHIQGDVLDAIGDGIDLMIAHPPCQYLCLSGARWFYDDRFPDRWERFAEAVDFFKKLQAAPIPKICIENSQPLGRTMAAVGRYDQIIQPWMFGSPYTKSTCLWLQGLPRLVATHNKPDSPVAKCHRMAPGPDRPRIRAQTEPEIAQAMAQQWGNA